MEQLKEPNLSVVGESGECLVYVREIFGVAAKYPTATAAWENAEFKHEGDQPPTDVSVPVWFSYNSPDGHVAVSSGGKIYSTSAQGDKVFSSVQELVDWMHEDFTYLGWSEDVDGVRVVQPAPTPAPAPETYTVVEGDTLSGIAEKFGLTLQEIEAKNPQIKDFNLIHPGEVVNV
jgi:LysM repeat protein